MEQQIINLPTENEIFSDETRLNLPKRLSANVRRGEMRKVLGEYADMSGCYVHYLEDENGNKTIIYIGQTSRTYAERLSFEFTMSREPVSHRFVEEMTRHINENHTIYTVLFPGGSEKMNKIIPLENVSPIESEKNRRLLLEQALIAKFNSENLLNSSH